MHFLLFLAFSGLLFPNISGFLTLSQTQTGAAPGSKTLTDISDVLYLVVEEKALRHQLEEFVMQMKNDIEQLKQNQSKSCDNKTVLLEQDIHVLKQNNSDLDQKVNILQQKNSNLEQNVNNLIQTVQVLQHDNSNLAQTVISLQNKSSNTEYKIQNLQQKDGLLNTSVYDNEMTIAGLHSSVNRNAEKVAFTIELNQGTALGHGNILKFKRFISNIGGGYNNTTGKFTCKIPGLYLFHVTILATNNHETGVQIVKSRQQKPGYIFTGSSSTGYNSGSGAVFYSLLTGDQVFVESVGSYTFHQYSVFSGALISAA